MFAIPKTRFFRPVFRKSGVKDAHVHRFRHTLATEVLVSRGSIEDAANILGDSPAIIRKHLRESGHAIIRLAHSSFSGASIWLWNGRATDTRSE